MTKRIAMDEDKPCVQCSGLGLIGSEIHHIAPGFTVCVDRKTEACPRCGGSGCEPDAAERIRLGLEPPDEARASLPRYRRSEDHDG